MEQLKECPFCGSEAEFSYYEAYSTDSSFDYVGCTNYQCGAMIFEGTAEQWNRRYQ